MQCKFVKHKIACGKFSAAGGSYMDSAPVRVFAAERRAGDLSAGSAALKIFVAKRGENKAGGNKNCRPLCS